MDPIVYTFSDCVGTKNGTIVSPELSAFVLKGDKKMSHFEISILLDL